MCDRAQYQFNRLTHRQVYSEGIASNMIRSTISKITNNETLRLVPRGVYLSAAAFVGLVFTLVVTSLAVSNVIAPQGFETYAMAKPVNVHRVIRQSEVDRFGGQVSNAFGINQNVATEFADWILEASERQNLSPELIASLVITESSFRKNVRSNVGAVGPAQVRPDYWGSFCGADDLDDPEQNIYSGSARHSRYSVQDDLDDPEQNIYCGAQILSHLLERCGGDQACALAAYNVGPYANRANAARRYVNKVDRYLDRMEAAASL